jgi:hypothetical protein
MVQMCAIWISITALLPDGLKMRAQSLVAAFDSEASKRFCGGQHGAAAQRKAPMSTGSNQNRHSLTHAFQAD